MLNATTLERTSRLGRLVVDKGWINEVQLEKALDYQAVHHCKLGESLIHLGLLSQQQLDKALCKQKWVRSFVAGMVMVSSPICPVLAGEQNDTLKFVAQAELAQQDYSTLTPGTEIQNNPIQYTQNSDFQMGISHRFSSQSGIEIGVATPTNTHFTDGSYVESQHQIVPQITFFTSQSRVSKENKLQNFHQSDRFDRYKNTIPAIYRLTLKGYSIFEATDKSSKYWEFNKIAESPYKNYEIMFSVTKQF